VKLQYIAICVHTHFRATGRHLPFGITQCYLPGRHPTQVNAPHLTPARKAGSRLVYSEGMKGWVDMDGR